MKIIRMAVIGLLTVASMSSAPAVAGAQTTGEDSVVGTAWDCTAAEPCEPDPSAFAFVELTADAHSGIAGQDARGTMTWSERSLGDFVENEARVTCLSVAGQVATVGVEGTRTYARVGITVPIAGLIRVEDGGGPSSGEDAFQFDIQQASPPFEPLPGPTDCSVPPAETPTFRNDGGDLVVTDTQPLPTSRDQCTNGGWQTYGYARYEQCLRAVRRHARLACRFERVAHGVRAFRDKYGVAYQGLDAFEQCVKSWVRGEQPRGAAG
jgi:hypothetical protein